MDCEEAQVLSIPHIMGDLDPDSEQYRELESHLASCQVCTEEYKNNEWAIRFIEEHKAKFAAAFEAIDREKAAEQEEIERSWKCIEARLDEVEAQERKQKHAKFCKLLVRVSAVAACLVIGVSIFLAFSIYAKPEVTKYPAPRQTIVASKPLITVELLSNRGNVVIPAGSEIKTSVNKSKTLIINNKHQIVMAADTVLSIEPLTANESSGCMVELASGQIYSHVEHNGSPFIVGTSQGRAVITGTIFDMKGDDDVTTLIVIEGSVQLQSEKGDVTVEAGQVSEIIGRSTPSKPVSCNIAELTAWATAYKNKTALTKINSSSDAHWFDDLEITVTTGPIDLEGVDYDYWIKENRDWFKQEFLQVFQLKEALAKEGIEVDYPELLVRSGDIWQFVFPESTKQRIPVISQKSLLRICSHYGYDNKWLFKTIPTVRYLFADNTATKDKFFGLEAFEQWSKCFKKAIQASAELDSDVLWYSFHAGFYIIKTRSLAWLCMQRDMFECQAQDKDKLLSLLQDEVKAADDLVQITMKAMAASKNPCTGGIPYLNEQIDCLDRIQTIEKQLTEYKDEIIRFEPF